MGVVMGGAIRTYGIGHGLVPDVIHIVWRTHLQLFQRTVPLTRVQVIADRLEISERGSGTGQ